MTRKEFAVFCYIAFGVLLVGANVIAVFYAAAALHSAGVL